MVWTAAAVLFVILPAAILFADFSDTILRRGVGYDFRVYYDASKALLERGTPYTPIDDAMLRAGKGYVYPPLTAVAVTPLTVLSAEAAGLLVKVLLAAAALAIPFVLGVRDRRCYGLVLLWPPVIHGVQTSNVMILLGLAAALVWRFRERVIPTGFALGTAFAMKLVLWPLGIWLAATRRYAATAWATGCAAILILGPWALIAFDGFGAYPALVTRLSATMDDRAYSVYGVALDLGAPSTVARLAWVVVAVSLLVGVVVTGRRGDDRQAFVLAVAAALAVSPIVWLPYFVLLSVVVAVAQPTLGLLWFVPLGMWVTAGPYVPALTESAGTVGIAALTVILALRALVHESRNARDERPKLVVAEAA